MLKLLPGILIIALTTLACSTSASASDFENMRRKVMSLSKLTTPPVYQIAADFESSEYMKAIYYDGLNYQGKPTKVFAWVGMPTQVRGKIPGVVLVHGGGGSAFKEWVQKWNDRGFAAISIAVEGQTDVRVERKWQQHAWPGPARVGIYGDSDKPLQDQWMYHAVSDTLLANSLLRSFPQVDADKVGVMGISWGGVITSTVMGIDNRFAFAIPTYGCGNLSESENQYGRALGNNEIYKQVWDPILRMKNATMPALWLSWPGDKHFALDKQAACYEAMTGEAMVSLIPGMKHGHGAGWNPPDSYAFAQSVVGDPDGKPWCESNGTTLNGDQVTASYVSSREIESAVLVSTTDTGATGERKWIQTPAQVVKKSRNHWVARATLPQNTTNWILNAQSNGLTVSSKYQGANSPAKTVSSIAPSQTPNQTVMPGLPNLANLGSAQTGTNSSSSTSVDGRPKQPNVVLILADDLGWQDVKCYDIDAPSPMETPNMDSLAKKGVMFWQAYSPAPTCAPSRCAIMSGNHSARAQKTHVVGGAPPAPNHRTGRRMMSPWYSGRMPADELTLAKVLKQNGYVTGHAGKWHMAIDHKAFPQPEDQGFDWTRSERGTTKPMKPDRVSDFATNDPEDPYRLDEQGFPFHQNSEDALDFLKEQKDKPFFLYYATWLVHSPIHTRSKSLLDKYVKKLGVEIPEDPSQWTGKGQTNPFYCAMVEQLDHYVGKLIHHLESTEDPRWPGHKLSENTYLIFTSDNGGMEWHPGEIITDNYPLDRGKISAMEGGTRVPLIITGPGIKQGVQSNVMVNGLDFYPTILSLVGAQKPPEKQFDGSDLAPLLLKDPTDQSLVKNAQGVARDTMVWHFPNSAALESTIRIGDYKLVRNYEHVENPNNIELELYRLYDSASGEPVRVDIEEAKNLVEVDPDKANQMNNRLTEILSEMKASYPYYNPHYKSELPNKEKVCQVVSCNQQDHTLSVQFKENGAKVQQANLIYTLNGGERYEEWFRKPAKLIPGQKALVNLPKGTTHYFINLIDENQFLVSHPEVIAQGSKKPESPFFRTALANTANTSKPAATQSDEAPYPGTGKLAAMIDQNKDGIITREEYLSIRSDEFKRKDKNGDGILQPQEHTHASFAKADIDQDGLLTRAEYLSIFEGQFKRFDQNEDGKIAAPTQK